MKLSYTNWYFIRHPHTFKRLADFEAVVGERPSPEFSLRRIDDKPLNAENFVWVTKSAIADAKNGKLNPPVFAAGTRSIEAININNWRFARLVEPHLRHYDRTKVLNENLAKWETELQMLLDRITDYVVQKGYDARDALNPEILPESTHPKLNAARRAAQGLMERIYNPTRLRRLDYQKWYQREYRERQRGQATPPEVRANRMYSGRRGRPVEKMIEKRVRISALTPEQKASFGIPADQDFYTIDTPKRRGQKVWTVKITVPNPKAKDANPVGAHS